MNYLNLSSTQSEKLADLFSLVTRTTELHKAAIAVYFDAVETMKSDLIIDNAEEALQIASHNCNCAIADLRANGVPY